MARPPKFIDWNLVEEKMQAGCSAKEIYGELNITDETFYNRFKQEFDKSFSEYLDEFHCAGKGNVRYIQYKKALDGNVQMLIWLGKQWLGQKEPEKTLEKGDIANIVEAVYEINERNRDRTTSQQGLENPQFVCDQRSIGEENTIQT